MAAGPPLLTLGAAAIWFWAVLALWVAFEVRLQLVAGPDRGSETSTDRFSMPVLIASVWVAVGGGLATAEWIPEGRLADPGSILVVLGGLVMILGLALRWWAVRSLGAHFRVRVTTSAGQKLVTVGPYRRLQHPAYTGALLTVMGCLLCYDDLASLALFVLPAAAYGWRIAVEERELRRRFGARYREYAAPRKRLIPHLF